ncbi:class I SAM-dependent methyltransferase [Plectonema cf. radiosum LEGE 06105]|uniref:Class I SAM-dependent methyltransferase n=1 Tax=Plectonema cf. radiosum LEGE 06105 TaxID=945769 RepID=A0A8J7K4U8_9CYAN|nr:class I SAM-dependent methyltransferase [Plectonema radiosum]MBE9216517.1 class I SAM-dependent methyltransferase [Plectonema cf. radiosum LEGE 06105]
MSSTASSFDKISPTSLMVAYARQFTDIPYSKELSQLVNAEAFVEQLETAVEQFQGQKLDRPVETAALFEARYKAINKLMSEFSSKQVIELASGLLPRGMTFSCDSNNIFIESDLPAMINRKQQLVKQLVGDRSNLYFVPIDATSQPSQFPLNADYLDSQKPITVICEGLLMYLTLKQKQQVFSNVRELLQVYGGVLITPDLVTKEDLKLRWQISPTWEKFELTVNKMTETSLEDGYFDNIEEVKQFAAEQGFKLQSHSMLNVLNQLTCLQPLGIDPAIAKSLLADASVFALTLQDVK